MGGYRSAVGEGCRPLLPLIALLLLPLGAAAGGQDPHKADCDAHLEEAQRHFQLGRLDQVQPEMQACLARGFDLEQRLVAWRLIAEARLAEDDLEGAEEAIREALAIESDFRVPNARPRFAALISKVSGEQQNTVSTVSKTAEVPRQAPATLMVITAEEIARRGYLDLEQLIHDLPGFDVVRQQGQPYSNIYPRGLRTTETNRLLLLVDGVEENDLATGAVWLSRQYPIAHVDRVEVIYGPASTIYGANAYATVINVVTRSPEDLLDPTDRFKIDGEVTAGSWNTNAIEFTAAGATSSGALRWSVSGRRYASDEFDFSSLDEPRNDDWDYDPAFYDGVDYVGRLSLSDAGAVAAFEEYLLANPQADCRGQVGCFFTFTPEGGVRLTPAGQAEARGRDRVALARPVGGEPPGFSNPTEDWWFGGKLHTDRLEVGFQSWRREEGAAAPLVDQAAAGGDNGFLWIPQFTSLYMRYSRPLPERSITLNLFARFKRHELDGGSATVFLRNYARGSLNLVDLLEGEESRFVTRFESRSNSQLRAELNGVYESPSKRFDLVAGVEARFSSIGAVNVVSPVPHPDETGQPALRIPGGNDIDSQDVGVYAQASYQLFPRLRLVAGGRVDHNTIRSTGGYGTRLSPRLAAVYTPGVWTFKAIYSEAFQDAPNFQRFSILPEVRELPAPDLNPAGVRNLDLSVGWQPHEQLAAELVLYQTEYNDIVREVTGVPCTLDSCTIRESTQFRNIGRVDVLGLQGTASYTTDRWQLWGNYTYTDPTNQDDALRSSDIAEHQLNLGFTQPFRERWQLAVRANYVGSREVGVGTSPGSNPAGEIDAFLVTHAALTWRDVFPRVPGLEFQFIVNNLLDEEYDHPGIRNGAGTLFASRIPQPERSLFLRLRLRH